MTMQTFTFWGLVPQNGGKSLAQIIQKIAIALALVAVVSSAQAAQPVEGRIAVAEMAESGVYYNKVVLVDPVPGGTVSLDIFQSFQAQYPEAQVQATLSGNGQTIALTISNGSGPITGTVDVCVLHVYDASGSLTDQFLVKMVDGIVETEQMDI